MMNMRNVGRDDFYWFLENMIWDIISHVPKINDKNKTIQGRIIWGTQSAVWTCSEFLIRADSVKALMKNDDNEET